MKRLRVGIVILLLSVALAYGADTGSQSVRRFDKVMIIILENANYRDALAQLFSVT